MAESFKHLVLFVRIVQKNMQPLPFEQFEGKYTIVEQLGRGASGICFHVVTKEERKHFALKKIPLQPIQPCKLNNEIKILSSVSHPNIIRLQQSYISKEFLYLLFDYNHERDLQKMIKQREKSFDYFPESFIWALLKKVLQALQYLHEKNIIHRDIKPSNIFANTEEDSLQIGDLGTAKIAENENYSRIGTPLYLPPEIIKYESYSEKIDVWSLGVTIFQLAALRPPFHNNNFIKLAQSITYEEPVYPAHFSKKLAQCIRQMLRKDHFQRPTCKQLLETYCTTETSQLIQKETQVSGSELQLIEENNRQEQEWKIELISQMLLQSRESQKKIGSQRSLFQQKEVDNEVVRIAKMQKMEAVRRGSSTKIASIRGDSVKQLINLPQLEDSDHTIVLQVNPNDYNNFCGYYKQSPRSSKIYYKSESPAASQLKMGRKSSLFKQTQASDSLPQPFSNFKVNHNSGHQKENNKKMVPHKRQQSGICRKQRHEELMSKLKAMKRQDQAVHASKQLQKPRLIIIDQRPLLIGQGSISDYKD